MTKAAGTFSPAETLTPPLGDQEIPCSIHKGLGRRSWFGGDSEAHFKTEPHPSLGTEDIEYAFNEHGYRCPEFSQRRVLGPDYLHLVVVGESHALGVGVPEACSYPALVAQGLSRATARSVQHWNLSQGGASADTIARLLPAALNVLDPDFVILNFPPGFSRHEYFLDDGRYLNCGEGDNVAGSVHTLPRHEETREAHFDLAARRSDAWNYLKMVVVCQRHLQQRDVMWLAKATPGKVARVRDYISMENVAPRRMRQLATERYANDPALGVARDGRHAGVGPHADVAADLIELFLTLYPDRIDRLRQASTPGEVRPE